MWRTDELRSARLEVRDEVRNGLYYVRESLFEAVPKAYQYFEKAIRKHYGVNPDGTAVVNVPSFIRFGSWIGGDRDGNPFVTADITELFGLLFANPLDARWLQALPPRLLDRLADLLEDPEGPAALHGPLWPHVSDWEQTLLDALAFCVGQVSAAGFTPELRVRMSRSARESRIFHDLPVALEAYRDSLARAGVRSNEARAREATLRRLLDECRHAAYTVYAHLDEHGISVGVVFRLRQLRERVLRAKTLLDCLQSEQRTRATARLLAQLVQVGQDSRSIRALIASSTQLTAARVAERSAETGEHYITLNNLVPTAVKNNCDGGRVTIS
jgi:site-specific recombinase